MTTITYEDILSCSGYPLAIDVETTVKRGIYSIFCLSSGYTYIGGTSSYMVKRWKFHLRDLKKGCHSNKYLQEMYDTYHSLIFFVLEQVPLKEDLIKREQWWLDEYRILGKPVFNIIPADPCIARGERSEETKQKISENHKRKGIKPSEDAWKRGNEVQRVKMKGNTYALGNRLSEETRLAIGKSSRGNQYGKGYRHTPEQIAKISQASKEMWRKRKEAK